VKVKQLERKEVDRGEEEVAIQVGLQQVGDKEVEGG
jgi:hypothetical protein